MAIYLIDKRYSQLALQLAGADEEAKVVLLQEGVYLNPRELVGKREIFCIDEDLEKRGIQELPQGFRKISYDDLVDMIEKEKIFNFI